ncbi:serine threonine- kinase Nek5-like isoform X1 [Labeo rohita]|nr:serine threonine- kinase Nek5-like isoform X1 [Labeo rohita]
MGNSLSVLKEHGYSLVSQQENKILVKNEGGDQFLIKKLSTDRDESNFLLHLNHPHIVQHKEYIEDSDCLYLVLEHCEGGDLAQKIKNKKEGNAMFSENEILDWIVKICMALKYLHDQQILHKNLQPEFPAILTVETVQKILTSSYEALPETFSEDLRQLVADTLQPNPVNRPSVSEILTRPFIINFLREKNMQTIKTLYRTLEELRALADDLERVHFNTTVGSLTGGVIGLTGGITSVVGLVLSPFTMGASLIVTGVGIACCIQNIQIAVETLERQFSTSDDSFSNTRSGANAGARLGRGLGGIPEILRVIEVVNVGKVAAQAARAVRVAEAATGVLSALFVAVDVFFVFLDSREIHNIRQDCALRESRRESHATSTQTSESTDQTSNISDTTNLLPSNAQQTEELKSETMKFVTKIKETTEELQKIVDTLRDAVHLNSENY